MRILTAPTVALVLIGAGALRAADSTSAPRPTPLTRPEMKQYLEDMKERRPRIELPDLTAEEKAKLGDREASYESRLRALYMPDSDGRGSFGGGFGGSRQSSDRKGSKTADGKATGGKTGRGSFGQGDPAMSLDYKFKTSLFWIVSRANNCQYCLGHQESKLLSAGMTEDEIASLDCNWQSFTPKEQAAFAFARRFTLEPHKLSSADIDELTKHYTDLQILEMILSMAGNNSINRWKEGVGVPQSEGGGGFGRRTEGAEVAEAPREPHSYLTPTSEPFRSRITLVASLVKDDAGEPKRDTVFSRPRLESRKEVEAALAQAGKRTPRLPLVEEAKAREILAEDAPPGALPQWMRLLLNFPIGGKRTVASVRSADEKGDLTPLLKAQVAWIIARQDRAWYAVGQAKARLAALGQSDERIYALDGDWAGFTPRERALFTVARNLGASPVVLTDEEVADAVKHAGNRDVVQLVSYVTGRASFDRITEAAGLQLEQ